MGFRDTRIIFRTTFRRLVLTLWFTWILGVFAIKVGTGSLGGEESCEINVTTTSFVEPLTINDIEIDIFSCNLFMEELRNIGVIFSTIIALVYMGFYFANQFVIKSYRPMSINDLDKRLIYPHIQVIELLMLDFVHYLVLMLVSFSLVRAVYGFTVDADNFFSLSFMAIFLLVTLSTLRLAIIFYMEKDVHIHSTIPIVTLVLTSFGGVFVRYENLNEFFRLICLVNPLFYAAQIWMEEDLGGNFKPSLGLNLGGNLSILMFLYLVNVSIFYMVMRRRTFIFAPPTSNQEFSVIAEPTLTPLSTSTMIRQSSYKGIDALKELASRKQKRKLVKLISKMQITSA